MVITRAKDAPTSHTGRSSHYDERCSPVVEPLAPTPPPMTQQDLLATLMQDLLATLMQ